jgi:hypothetical protein
LMVRSLAVPKTLVSHLNMLVATALGKSRQSAGFG